MSALLSYKDAARSTTRSRSVLGVSPREMNILLAVMAHESGYGTPPLTDEVERFVARMEAEADEYAPIQPVIVRATALARFGWIEIVVPRKSGVCRQRIRATAKCWRVFGFSRDGAS